jgi:hypothetical protein
VLANTLVSQELKSMISTNKKLKAFAAGEKYWLTVVLVRQGEA